MKNDREGRKSSQVSTPGTLSSPNIEVEVKVQAVDLLNGLPKGGLDGRR